MTGKKIWTPTRRAFVAMLGLGAAALAVVQVKRSAPQSSTATPAAPEVPATLWIGHC
ncbi:MAG: hypothetical protein ABI591_22895 [Kofleriaceae bacterium]